MTAASCETTPKTRRIYSEKPGPFVNAKKLRVVQIGSYPAANRGARANLLNIHERLQARGHESVVIDLTPFHRVKQQGVYYPRTTLELVRLLREIPAHVVHLQMGSLLTMPKVAATVAVWAELAGSEGPPELLAMTVTHRVDPTSVEPTA